LSAGELEAADEIEHDLTNPTFGSAIRVEAVRAYAVINRGGPRGAMLKPRGSVEINEPGPRTSRARANMGTMPVSAGVTAEEERVPSLRFAFADTTGLSDVMTRSPATDSMVC